MRGFRVLIVVLATTGFGSPAFAQSDTVVVSGSDLGVMTTSQTEARTAELERAYNSVNLAGPRAGVGITAILVPGATMMMVSGVAARNLETRLLCPLDDPHCGDPSAGSAALIAVGTVLLVGGLVGVALSSRRLKRRKEERRRIEWKIAGLEGSQQAP
jgi:hypothetical protein